MSSNNSIGQNTNQLIEHIKEWVELRLELFRFSMSDKILKGLTGFLIAAILVLVLFFVVMFLSFAFANWYGQLSGNYAVAYLLTAGIYVLIGVLVFAFRRHLIVDPITRLWFNSMNDEEDEDED